MAQHNTAAAALIFEIGKIVSQVQAIGLLGFAGMCCKMAYRKRGVRRRPINH